MPYSMWRESAFLYDDPKGLRSEIRSPNLEIRNKREFRRPQDAKPTDARACLPRRGAWKGVSFLGLRAWNLFRVSGFGFRASDSLPLGSSKKPRLLPARSIQDSLRALERDTVQDHAAPPRIQADVENLHETVTDEHVAVLFEDPVLHDVGVVRAPEFEESSLEVNDSARKEMAVPKPVEAHGLAQFVEISQRLRDRFLDEGVGRPRIEVHSKESPRPPAARAHSQLLDDFAHRGTG